MAAQPDRTEPDLIIRGGRIVDGSGGAPYTADIAISDGRIAAIGTVAPTGAREIDARGKLVVPGFVDVHTHYDAQVTWSSHVDPSSWNGVTTVLIGNCGVGFAPCRPEQRDMLVQLMEGVEDIPEVVMTEGLPWNWETFPDFLDRLGERRFDLDVATQVPHAAVRVYVMGQRGADREPSTDAERAEMARIAAEGIRAGALGFSTSRTLAHKTPDGRPTPTLDAAEDELAAIADALGETKAGWMQVISDFVDVDGELAMMRRLAARSGQPLTLSLLQRDSRPEQWKKILDEIAAANQDGVTMIGQVMARPIGVMLGFEISQNPFMGRPSFAGLDKLPFPERMARLRDPDMRARLLSETIEDPVLRHRVNTWTMIFPLEVPLDYEPVADRSVAALAAKAGVPVEEFVYDLLLENGGKTILYRPIINYAAGNLEAVATMMEHPNTILGLGDGGAHVGIICDAAAPTYTITHWTRDRTRGELMELPWIIKRLTRDPAVSMGLLDRGLVQVGYKADLNILDYDRMKMYPPEVLYDLPAGGRRLVQRCEGYAATIVSGVPVRIDGIATGELPGRLVRGPQQPAASMA